MPCPFTAAGVNDRASAGADVIGGTSSPTPGVPATGTPLLQSLLAFMSDTVIMGHTLCVVLTPRLDYALVVRQSRHHLGPFLDNFAELPTRHRICSICFVFAPLN